MTTPTMDVPRIEVAPRGVWLRVVGLLLIAAILVASFVTASMFGRGTRPAFGIQRKADSGGIRIDYYEAGSGSAVVFLASWARPASDFNELATSVANAGFRAIAIESRGIGRSQGGGPGAATTLEDLATDVDAVLRDAGVPHAEPVHLVGHAFGNRVARMFGSRFPNKTRSLTLIAAGGRTKTAPELTEALTTSSLTFMPWSRREPALRRALFAEGNEIPDYWRTGWSLWGGLSQTEATRSTPPNEYWAGGSAPMLVFQALEDVVTPPEEAGLSLAAEFPERVTLIEVPNAGHALLSERPKVIRDAYLRFLASIP